MKQNNGGVKSVAFSSGTRAKFIYEHAVQITARFPNKKLKDMVKLSGNVVTVPVWFPLCLQ